MRIVALALAIMAFFGAGRASRGASHAAGAALVKCRAVDSVAVNQREYIVQIATGTDSTAAADREAWQMPAISDPTQISFVTTSSVCDRAAKAHATRLGESTTNPVPVHVLRVGPTHYVVFNYFRVGEYLVYLVFDQDFVLLSSVGT